MARPRVRLARPRHRRDAAAQRQDASRSGRAARSTAPAASGVRLVLVTGRRQPSARRVAEDLGGDVPLVLHNGALVVDEGRVLRCRPLPRAVGPARHSRRARGGGGARPALRLETARAGCSWTRRRAPAGLVGYYLDRSRAEVRGRAGPRSPPWTRGADPGDVRGRAAGRWRRFSPPSRRRSASAARIERTVYPSTGVVLLDVLDASVGKAEALAFLQERWGIASAETLAIGDNWNDREMVERPAAAS